MENETKKQVWVVCEPYLSKENKGAGILSVGKSKTGGIDVFFGISENSLIKNLEEAEIIAEIIVNALNKNEDGN